MAACLYRVGWVYLERNCWSYRLVAFRLYLTCELFQPKALRLSWWHGAFEQPKRICGLERQFHVTNSCRLWGIMRSTDPGVEEFCVLITNGERLSDVLVIVLPSLLLFYCTYIPTEHTFFYGSYFMNLWLNLNHYWLLQLATHWPIEMQSGPNFQSVLKAAALAWLPVILISHKSHLLFYWLFSIFTGFN